MGKQKEKFVCPVCLREIKKHAALIRSHLEKHARKGEIKKSQDGTFAASGKSIEINKPAPQKNYIPPRLHRPRYRVVPRKPVATKKNKNGTQIKCYVCKRWQSAEECLIDDRFLSIYCCGNLILLPKRLEDSVQTKETLI